MNPPEQAITDAGFIPHPWRINVLPDGGEEIEFYGVPPRGAYLPGRSRLKALWFALQGKSVCAGCRKWRRVSPGAFLHPDGFPVFQVPMCRFCTVILAHDVEAPVPPPPPAPPTSSDTGYSIKEGGWR